MEIGFDNEKYVKKQSENIRKRFKLFDKLYLEVGGKLFDDNNAARVLPGFKIDAKINMFLEFKDDLEIIFCINANDIEKHKSRMDFGITYDIEVLRLINTAKEKGFSVNSVVITMVENQKSIDAFVKKMEKNHIKTYLYKYIKGYPADVDMIVSDKGYGANPYIKTTKKLILVSAPGGGSGKLATCLSQVYHENKNGVAAGYAKFETFPVWNLPLKHPVNLSYEAATADLGDFNIIDPFHLEKYNISAVNYNRDVETFPLLKTILQKIIGRDLYFSPTDMGVNMVKEGIIDDDVVCESAKKEIVRRYFNEKCNLKIGTGKIEAVNKVEMLMNEINLNESILDTIAPAIKKAKKEHKHVLSIKLPDGKIITGKETELLSPVSSAILNAIKEITNIPDDIYLISDSVLKPILNLKNNISTSSSRTLKLQEVLIALSICAVTNPIIQKALDNIKNLEFCDAHSTYIITGDELKTLKNLRINLTSEPNFYEENIY